jgi:chromosome segregation ATPase
MESADAVYGITMSDDGVSQAISLRLDQEKAQAVAK